MEPYAEWRPLWTNDPKFMAEMERLRRRDDRADRLTNWMRHIPVVGEAVRVFWWLVLTEGDPRDGMAFSYLNDGHRPSLWHTWFSMTHDNRAPLSGIYPKGAPKNRQEAENYK